MNPTPERIPERSRTPFVALALAGALVGAARALTVLLGRVDYPFHLEFLETNLLSQAFDLVRGGALYGDPSRDFVPHEYGPLYPLLLAPLFALFGPSFPLARALSSLATLGTVLSLAAWVRAAGGRISSAVLAGALYLALFGASGCWYDLARVDSLAIFLLVAGAGLLHARENPGSGKLGLAILLLLAAAFSKQTTVPIAAVALLSTPLPVKTRLLGLAVYAVVGAGLALAANQATDGRFLAFTVLVPMSHGLFLEGWLPGLALLFSPPTLAFPLLAAGSVAGLLCAGRDSASKRAALLFGAAGAISLLTLFKVGAWVNDLMPAAAFGTLAAALALDRAQRAGAGFVPVGLASLLLAAVPVGGWFSVRAQIPEEADRRAGEALVSYLRGFPGRFWVADFNYLHVLAGGIPPPTAYAVAEIVEPFAARREDLAALERGEFDLVLADPDTPVSFRARLLAAYRRDERMPSLPADLRTRTGQGIGLAEVWVPKARAVDLPPFPAEGLAPR
ncbi:MAG: hypothetical protein L0323_02100 [Planctomycetes bacterium]|nr:hypothetical protein [Planctomycetota bacterium]